jgi:hypothetical protein
LKLISQLKLTPKLKLVKQKVASVARELVAVLTTKVAASLVLKNLPQASLRYLLEQLILLRLVHLIKLLKVLFRLKGKEVLILADLQDRAKAVMAQELSAANRNVVIAEIEVSVKIGHKVDLKSKWLLR